MNDETATDNDVLAAASPHCQGSGPSPALAPAPHASAGDSGELLRRQQAVVAMGRRAIASPGASILLHDAAELIAEMLGADASAVAEMSADGAALSLHLAIRSPDRASPRTMRERRISRDDLSLAAYALRVAHPVVSGDLLGEERFQDRFLVDSGFRSALAVPLKLQDRSFGALMACSVEPHRLTPEDVPFAETIGHLAATAVARSQAERSLAEQQSFSLGLLQSVGALILVLNAEGRALRINRVCERATGFSLADLRDRPMWSVFATAADAELYRARFEEARRGKANVEHESFLLTKHSEKRRVRWSYGLLPGAEGMPETILASGIDTTDQYEAQQRAERAEQVVEQFRRAASRIPMARHVEGQDDPHAAQGQGPASTVGGWVIPSDPILRERRQRQRRAFPYRQSVAPILDGSLPPRDQFRDVQCHDIAPGGLAFLSEKPPEFDLLVVALGTPPRLTHVIAQVVHVTPTDCEGETMYLVGCKYVGRAPY